jgi:hypothetical protein
VLELWRLMLTGGGGRNLGSQKLLDSHPSSWVVPWSAGTLACWCPVVLVPWLECKYPGVLNLSLSAHWRRRVNSLLPKSALRGEEVVPARAGLRIFWSKRVPAAQLHLVDFVANPPYLPFTPLYDHHFYLSGPLYDHFKK